MSTKTYSDESPELKNTKYSALVLLLSPRLSLMTPIKTCVFFSNLLNWFPVALKEHTRSAHSVEGHALWKKDIKENKNSSVSGSWTLGLEFWVSGHFHTTVSHTHIHTPVPYSECPYTLQLMRNVFLEDLRTLAPVLSVFGFPVATPVDVGVFSRWIVCPPLKPEWLVTLDVLP